MNQVRTEYARVFIGPAPKTGSHPGYRGTFRFHPYGLETLSDVEVLLGDLENYDSDWEPLEVRAIIPWHNISLLELGPA